jgi:hypothetical protein
MTVLCHDDLEQNSSEQASARSQWRARVLFVGGGFQGVVGAWWLVRGLAPLTTWLVAGIFGAVVVLAGVTVTSSLLSSAPRPQGSEARRIERRLTVATLVQLSWTVLAPWGLAQLQWQRLSLPFIMASIGILLVWIHREVDVPFQGTAGRLLIGLSIVTLALSGTAQTAFAGLAAAAVLLGCAVASYHWLEHRLNEND